MKTFDELKEMTDEQREAYLEEQEEAIISKAYPHSVLKLRHLQSELKKIRRSIKNPQVRAERIYGMMFDSLYKLNAAFKGQL